MGGQNLPAAFMSESEPAPLRLRFPFTSYRPGGVKGLRGSFSVSVAAW